MNFSIKWKNGVFFMQTLTYLLLEKSLEDKFINALSVFFI
jgi:hypothetical protein